MLILSFFFCLSIFIGYSFSRNGNWDLLFASTPRQIVANIIILILSTIIVNIILSFVFKEADLYIRKSSAHASFAESSRKMKLFSLVIMILCWSPYVIAHLPGSVPFDGMTMLLEHFGRIPHYAHHPVFMTRLYGSIVQVGAMIINENFGVFLAIVFNALLCGLVYSAVCAFVYEITSSKKLWVITLLFYAIFPAFGSYVSAVLKDTFYMAVATWFILNICRYVINHDFRMPVYIVSAICVCLSRREGFILVVLTTLSILLVEVKAKDISTIGAKPFLIALIIIVAFNSSFNFFVHNICKVPKGEVQEALSVVFQQTARYVTYYPEEVTEEERAVIDQILPYDAIADSYNPGLSDPIKGKMRSDLSASQYLEYVKVWLKMGLKKPSVYIQATLANTYGYFYPLFKGGVYETGIDHGQTERWGTEELNIHYLVEDSAFEHALFNYVIFLGNMPIIGLLFNPGFYFWLLIFCVSFIIYKRRFDVLALFTFPVITYLVAFASPVNGNDRYLLCVISSIILLCVTMLKKLECR